ncbi:MAG: hypothetical protein ACEQR5_06585 [Moraxellaceae bacterium]
MVQWNAMVDLATTYEQHKDLPEDDQKRIAASMGDDMDDEHKNFLALIIGMLDREEINVFVPESFIKYDVYDTLVDAWRAKVVQAMLNIAIQLRQIEVI